MVSIMPVGFLLGNWLRHGQSTLTSLKFREGYLVPMDGGIGMGVCQTPEDGEGQARCSLWRLLKTL
jgi:hypothetical protein